MASPQAEQGSEARPAVDPIGWLDGVVARFATWSRGVGPDRVAYAVLVLAFALAAVLILAWGKGQTFVNDEWSYLVNYRSWSLETLLTPQNGHLLLVPLLLYKTLFAVAGAESHLPYQLTTLVLHLTVATLFFCLVRRRLPLAVATALTVLLTFFGAGWDTIMSAYEIPNLTGIASGLALLLALERRTPAGNVAACLFLAISLASFSVGIAFAFAALFAVWLGGRAEWRRLWVALVPIALYAAWFLWARKFDQTQVTAEGVSGVFSGMADQLAAICAAITGLFRVSGNSELANLIEIRPEWGYPLALVLGGLVALHLRRAPRSIRFWTVAGLLVAYLALVAIGLDEARAPNASRYVYMGGVLGLLLLAELARDIRWTTVAGLLAAVFLGLSLLANAAELRAGGRLFEAEGATNRATLAALELARDRVDPELPVEDASTTHSHPDMLFSASAWFGAADEFGSPAYDDAELAVAGEQAREAADAELVRMLGIAAAPATGAPPSAAQGRPLRPISASGGHASARGGCLSLRPDSGAMASFDFELPPGGFAYRVPSRAEVQVALARFGSAYASQLPAMRGGAEVAIPADGSTVPWRAQLTTDAKTLACPR